MCLRDVPRVPGVGCCADVGGVNSNSNNSNLNLTADRTTCRLCLFKTMKSWMDGWGAACFVCLDSLHPRRAGVTPASPTREAFGVGEEYAEQVSHGAERECARILNAESFYAVLEIGGSFLSYEESVQALTPRMLEARKNYKILARSIHPDRCHQPDAEEAFSRLQEAYFVLSDQRLHKMYAQALADHISGAAEGLEAWHAHQRGHHVKDAEQPKPQTTKKVVRESDLYLSSTGYYIATPHSELVQQAEAMLAQQSRSQPMARSAKARREAEARAGRERARLAKLAAEDQRQQQEKAERREAAERALNRARSKEALKRAPGAAPCTSHEEGHGVPPRKSRNSSTRSAKPGDSLYLPRDYYADLGLFPEASDEDLKAAYRSLVFKHHPDRVPSSQQVEATEKLATLNAAWDVLGDSERRRCYDLQCGNVKRTST